MVIVPPLQRHVPKSQVGGLQMRHLVLTILLLGMIGCGATRSGFIPGGTYAPGAPSDRVLVFFEGAPPDQPYDVIGLVYAEKEANSATRWDIVSPEAVVELLKSKAQAAGAEAIIDVRVSTLPDRRRDYKKGEAKAIVFRKG
jgi:hypothetical protein